MSVNPCRLVMRPKLVTPEHELWSDEETKRFERKAADDRLHSVITLQCLGLWTGRLAG